MAQLRAGLRHCGGHYPAHAPHRQADATGYPSLLISGGCDARGGVPITNSLSHVERLRPGRRLNWHVGFADRAELARVAPLVDVISFDVVGDRDTALEVYGLDVSLEDYMRQLDLLQTMAPVVPHLTLGLRGGRISGEGAPGCLTERHRAAHLIILIPTAGTRYGWSLPWTRCSGCLRWRGACCPRRASTWAACGRIAIGKKVDCLAIGRGSMASSTRAAAPSGGRGAGPHRAVGTSVARCCGGPLVAAVIGHGGGGQAG